MRAWLFDLDDTLIDYSGGVETTWVQTCRAVCPSHALDAERLIEALVPVRRWFWEDPERHRRERVNMVGAWTKIAAHALERIGRPDAEAARALGADYGARRREAHRIYDDAIACLERLRAGGAVLGLVTNGDALLQRDKIARWDLAKHFGAMAIEGEFGVGKPDPAVYRHVLGGLGVAPEDACMVGDHLEFDVDGAQRLGMKGIWIDRRGTGMPQSPVKPWRVIRSLAELA